MKSIFQTSFRLSEFILLFSGFLILISVFILSLSGGFGVWTVAIILYGIGVILFLFDK